jgi:hypothetical protein
MKRRNAIAIAVLFLSVGAIAQNKILWNGELANPTSCNKAYGSILSGADAHSGSYYLRAEPDATHSPRLGFNCSGAWRADISTFDELRLFIKSSVAGQPTSLRFTTYFAKSNWVQVAPHIIGGTSITTAYQEVRIPLHLFKTAGYNLNSIEYIEFEPSPGAQVQFYVDDMEVSDNTPPTISMEPVSEHVLKFRISERFDTTGCYTPANYALTSPTDPDNLVTTHPSKIGRHSTVTGLAPGSGSPVIDFELFLIFDKPLKNDQNYSLTVNDLKDLSQNTVSLDTTFKFSDQNIYGNIKVNQVGYLTNSPKLGKLGNFLGDAWFIPIETVAPPAFEVLDLNDQVILRGSSTFLKADSSFSGEQVFELDFSTLTSPGKYYLRVPGYGRSHDFEIGDNVYDQAYWHSARALYFQRSGELMAANAGQWARAGLPAAEAEIHTSHTSSPLYNDTDHAPGTHIPMTKGWLDAGDYGRYVPTAASAMFILFTAFELYPQKFPDNHLNIPESGNNIPDILDELKYEADWMKQMQAPDGGVYFRVTPATWSQGLPGEENNVLYVSGKTTQATALYAASMAMAYRNFLKYMPAYADSCLERARKAWMFLQAHPTASAPVNVPGISAGPYPDPEDRDNRAWAAAELYKSTGEALYNTEFQNWYAQIPHQFHATMSWQQHTVKAAWAYATTKFPVQPAPVEEFKNKLTSEILVNYYNRTVQVHAYHGAYHPFKGYVGYGTFGMAQSYAFDYIMFSHLLNKPDLLDYAKMQIDIPLGNNPLSHSFITGLGKKSPRFPLHWSTVPGKFNDPVPGVPVFGPAASLLMNRPSSFAIQDSANRYPYGFKKEDPYPVLRRYTDTRAAVEMAEFTVQEIAVTAATFAFFSSADAEALPVTLRRFEAKPDHCRISLSWATSEEINADYFSVQRSSDGKTFDEIGRIPAVGDTKRLIEYQIHDTQPGNRNFYQLKQVDRDGKFIMSRIVYTADPCDGIEVKIGSLRRNAYEIHITSDRQTPNQTLTARLFNGQGILAKHFHVRSAGTTHLDGAGLAPGIYILKIQNDMNREVYAGKILIY